MSTPSTPSVADEVGKLSKLRSDGAITDAEFQQQKDRLFGAAAATTDPAAQPAPPSATSYSGMPSDWSAVPLKNRWWFQAVMLLLIIPVGILLMLFCPAYRKKRGQAVRIGKGTKLTSIILALLLWALNVAKLVGYANLGSAAGTLYSTVAKGANSASSSPEADSVPGDALGACNDDNTKRTVRQIVEQDGQTKIVDIGDAQEVSCPALNMNNGGCLKTGDKERYCNIQLFLSSGTVNAKFRMFYGPSGKPLIEVQEGSWTDWSKMK
jgi:hypothetical protein